MMFETARGIVHAWQCDHMGHANLRAYAEFFEGALWPGCSRTSRAFPPQIARVAKEMLS